MIVELTSEAAHEAIEAALGYENEREGLGVRFEEQLDVLFERVAATPAQFPRVSGGAQRALMRVFPYAVYFVVHEERVRVFAILHQHREPGTWRNR